MAKYNKDCIFARLNTPLFMTNTHSPTPIPDQVRYEIEVITSAMLEKKAQRVCSLDLRNPGASICDHFVICHANSATQVVAITDYIEEMMFRLCQRNPRRSQGRENAFWVIIDYVDIVVHIFQTEYRSFYRLEELWADAPIKQFQTQE